MGSGLCLGPGVKSSDRLGTDPPEFSPASWGCVNVAAVSTGQPWQGNVLLPGAQGPCSPCSPGGPMSTTGVTGLPASCSTHEVTGHWMRVHSTTQTVKRLPALWETRVQSLGQEDPLEKAMAPHSSTLAWEIPWMEEPGGLRSMGPQRVRQDQATSVHNNLILASARLQRPYYPRQPPPQGPGPPGCIFRDAINLQKQGTCL